MAEFDGEPSGPLGTGSPGSADLITEARERYQLCVDAEDRDDALDDLNFLLGGENQWDPDAVQQRKLDNRPCLTFNNFPAILHQLTNDARRNKQSIHVAAVDDGADVKVADVIAGLIRHIEYDSDADAAYDTALEGAARVGFGYFRLTTEYCAPMSFDQDIKIKRIRNPFTVYLDPDAQEADGSDAQYAFISSKVSLTEFQRLHPGKAASGDGIGTAPGDNSTWVGKDYVRLAEYYRVEHEPDELYMLPDGTTILKSSDEFKAAATAGVITAEAPSRPTFRRKVMWYKINGWEALEQAEIACNTIPVFPVYGDEIDVDGTVTRAGIIRNAKSPKKMENYWNTSATEEIAMRTKTPFIGALGQFEGLEADWNQANTSNFDYLEYNPVSLEGSLVPAPQRQPPADVPTGFIQMAMMARDSVKAVTGIYDASLGNRSNEVSGIAIRARQQQGDISNFHFTDNLTRAITRMAKCLIQMIPRIYDRERVVRILGEDRRTANYVPINKPEMKKPEDGGDAIQTVLNDLTVGTYDVTVSTGPAYNTLREETVANMVEVGGKWPKLFEIAGDKLVKAMDWPGAQEIAERIEKTLPAELRDKPEGEEYEPSTVQTPQGPIPIDQAGQLIGQMNDAMERMQADMEKLESGMAKAELDNSTKVQIAEINAESRADVEELKGMIAMLLSRMDPTTVLAAGEATEADNDAKPGAAAPAGAPAPAPIESPIPAEGQPPAAIPEPAGGVDPAADGAAIQ